MDLLHNPVPLEQGAANEQGILEVYLILFIVAVVGEFGIASQRQLPAPA